MFILPSRFAAAPTGRRNVTSTGVKQMNKMQEKLILHAAKAIPSGLVRRRRLKVSVTPAQLVEVLQYLEAHCTVACVGTTGKVRFKIRHHVSTGWMTVMHAVGATINKAVIERQMTRFKLPGGKTICSLDQGENLPILWWVGDFADKPAAYAHIDLEEEYAVLEAIHALEAMILIGGPFVPAAEEIINTLQRAEDLFTRLYQREPDRDKKDLILRLAGPWRRNILAVVRAKPLPYNGPIWPPIQSYQLPTGEVITFRGSEKKWLLHRIH